MIVLLIISILISAFFTTMEMAFVSSNRMLLKIERNNKSKSVISKIYVFLANHSKQYFITINIANTISLIIYGYSMGKVLTVFFDRVYLPYIVILLLQMIISTFVFLLTAKFLPKVVIAILPNQLVKFFSPLAFFFYCFFYPLTFLVDLFSKIILKVTSQDNHVRESVFLKEELIDFIDESIENAEEKIDAEVHFFKNALNFPDLEAKDCMILRKEIVAVNIEDDIKKLTQDFIDSGFSKIVVYRNIIDHVIGYIHIFNLFKKPESIKHILLPIEIVYETTPVQEVMNKMLKKSRTIAIVIDQKGETSGLLTLEDIVEELFGDIEDEYDKSTDVERQIDKNRYLFSAELPIEYLNEKYDTQISENEKYNSLGGFVVSLIDEKPLQGKELVYGNLNIYLTKVCNFRIEEVEILILNE